MTFYVQSPCVMVVAIMTLLAIPVPSIEAKINHRSLGPNELFASVGGELLGSKASDLEDSLFGATVSLSADGTILAVGAPRHDYITPQADARLVTDNAGSITIFQLVNGVWKRVWFITGTAAETVGKYFSLSRDGSRIAIRRSRNKQAPVEVYSVDPSSNVKKRVGTDLNVPCYDGYLGSKVTLSGDGNRIAVSCENFNLNSPGKVSIFEWDGKNWSPIGGELTGLLDGDCFGWATAFSFDGSQLAISAPNFDSPAPRVLNCGIVHIFSYNQYSNKWSKVARDLVGTSWGEQMGYALQMSPDGQSVAIGSPGASPGGMFFAGAVQIFRQSQSDVWTLRGNAINGVTMGERFGSSVAISNDGLRVSVASSDLVVSASLRLFTWEISKNTWKQYGVDIPGDGLAINRDATMMACASSKYNSVGKVQLVDAAGLGSVPDPPQSTPAPSAAFGTKLGISSAQATGVCYFSFNSSDTASAMWGGGRRRRLQARVEGNRLIVSPEVSQEDFEIFLGLEDGDLDDEPTTSKKQSSALPFATFAITCIYFPALAFALW